MYPKFGKEIIMINTFTVFDKAQCSEFHVVRLSRTYPGTYLLNVGNIGKAVQM